MKSFYLVTWAYFLLVIAFSALLLAFSNGRTSYSFVEIDIASGKQRVREGSFLSKEKIYFIDNLFLDFSIEVDQIEEKWVIVSGQKRYLFIFSPLINYKFSYLLTQIKYIERVFFLHEFTNEAKKDAYRHLVFLWNQENGEKKGDIFLKKLDEKIEEQKKDNKSIIIDSIFLSKLKES